MVIKFKTISETGIHSRPATNLVQLATKFDSEIFLIANNKKVNLKSIMGVMSLGLYKGIDITFEAIGKDEKNAIDALLDFMISEKLGRLIDNE